MKKVISYVFVAVFTIWLCSCEKDLTVPTVITSEITSISQNSATSGGIIQDDGGSKIIAKGLCWSTDSGSLVTDFLTNEGERGESFTSTMYNLSPGTTYFMRAYATNTTGTGYGEELSFKTLGTAGSGSSCQDCEVWNLLYSESFESFGTGTHPGTPWVTRFSGNSAGISEEVAYEGTKSFMLSSDPMWARVEAIPMDTLPDQIRYEGAVYLAQENKGYAIGFGFKESGNTYRYRNAVGFKNGNKSAGVTEYMDWEPGKWYKIVMECNFNTLKGRICVDGVIVDENFDINDKDVCNDFMLGGYNFSGGTSTAYFDDIKIYYKE